MGIPKVTHEDLIDYLTLPRTVAATAEHFNVTVQAIHKRVSLLVDRGLISQHLEKPLAEATTYRSLGQAERQVVPGLRRRVLSVMIWGKLHTIPAIARATSLPQTSVYPLLTALVAARRTWSFSAAGRGFYTLTRVGERARDEDELRNVAEPADLAAECGPFRSQIFWALGGGEEAESRRIREGLSVEGRSDVDVQVSKAIAGLRRDGLLRTRADTYPQRHSLTPLGLRAARYISTGSVR